MADQADGFLSPFLRKKRIEMALPFIKGRVIDIGCGVGKLAKYVEAENYVGIDKDIECIRTVKRKYPNYAFYTLEQYRDIEDKFATVAAYRISNCGDRADS